MSNSTCGPGLPCIIEARSRKEKAVPSAPPAMFELPELITINQAESIQGFGKERNSKLSTEVKEWRESRRLRDRQQEATQRDRVSHRHSAVPLW